MSTDLTALSPDERALYERRLVDGLDMAEDLRAIHRDGWSRPGKKLGFGQFDELFSLVPGLLYVVTGVPSHGKSGFVDALVCVAMKAHAASVVYFSPENLPIGEHYAHLAQRFTGEPITGPDFLRMKSQVLENFIANAGPRFRWMTVGSEDGWTVDSIVQTIKLANLASPVSIAVVDPWNEIEHQIPHGMTETSYISMALTKLRLLARETGIAMFVVAHPAKPDKNVKADPDKESVPNLYSISGSAHWYNKCDFGLTVWRDVRKEIDNEPATVSVIVQKCRFGRHGRKGIAEFTYDKATGVYRAIPEEPAERPIRDWRGGRD